MGDEDIRQHEKSALPTPVTKLFLFHALSHRRLSDRAFKES